MEDKSMFNRNVMDSMALISFLIGLANYGENLDQSKAQEMLNGVLKELHGHLKEQDEKIDMILERLEGMNDER